MKKITTLLLTISLALPVFSQKRGHIAIPNLNGFVTLKADFHIHTIFSDGTVWPTVRVDEAYREGLDVISITDHIEESFQIRRRYVTGSRNSSYEIAKAHAQGKGIMVVRGGEISRRMPPGHLNAIFLTDAEELNKPDYMDALRAAKAQGAFIFWCHPGWDAQQPDTTLWFDEHTKILEQGLMHGIEVVNETSYYPEAHGWCLEKNLTMVGSLDVHEPVQSVVDFAKGQRRPMTLVFAREATPESVREALFARRTAVYNGGTVIGEEKYLKELFENALEWDFRRSENAVHITVKNNSDLVFRLKKANHDPRLVYFRNFTIEPQSKHSFTVRFREGAASGDVNFIVENFLVGPNKGMSYTIKL